MNCMFVPQVQPVLVEWHFAQLVALSTAWECMPRLSVGQVLYAHVGQAGLPCCPSPVRKALSPV